MRKEYFLLIVIIICIFAVPPFAYATNERQHIYIDLWKNELYLVRDK
ncbi:hypothetical protein IQ10_00850 [Halalkalibacter nanhaiisediminis]|uniref:Uncharacterized protein n=1 Tax=Halalkalibacter nanhaiisediminis TaxID=688079 RepID=A0A562QQV6_9BACI|nr:hypothetical protein IQ10_00850 [Halalkalibacter nanhaiisediminis]